jgi:hypothetical protein
MWMVGRKRGIHKIVLPAMLAVIQFQEFIQHDEPP